MSIHYIHPTIFFQQAFILPAFPWYYILLTTQSNHYGKQNNVSYKILSLPVKQNRKKTVWKKNIGQYLFLALALILLLCIDLSRSFLSEHWLLHYSCLSTALYCSAPCTYNTILLTTFAMPWVVLLLQLLLSSPALPSPSYSRSPLP